MALYECRMRMLDSRRNFQRSRGEKSSLRGRQRDEETIRASRVPLPRFSPLSGIRGGPAAIRGRLGHAIDRASGLNRTFGSLAGFAALAFLSLGIYLLADAFTHPVDAEAAGIIVAALAIALAILLPPPA